MVEYHGWVKISEATCESEDDEQLLKAVLIKVDSLIERNRTNDHVKLLDQIQKKSGVRSLEQLIRVKSLKASGESWQSMNGRA